LFTDFFITKAPISLELPLYHNHGGNQAVCCMDATLFSLFGAPLVRGCL